MEDCLCVCACACVCVFVVSSSCHEDGGGSQSLVSSLSSRNLNEACLFVYECVCMSVCFLKGGG